MKHLFKKQAELDNKIYEQHNVKAEDLLKEKVLSLQVELSELANETRCFKYWSKKPASDKEIIIEEYVDGLHFILSIGNLLGYEDYIYKASDLKNSLVELFIGLHNFVALLLTKDNTIYEKCFKSFIDLGYALGFSWSEVVEAYDKKYEINLQRLESGY